jgi:cobalt-zinc-cadmium efflux system protein
MAGDGHSHGTANERRTFWAAVITATFMIVEFWGGVIAGSLALIADAAHMLTDAISLTFAWYAFRLARRPADESRTYGYHRFQVLVAFANGIAMFFVIGWIFFEAVQRLFEPEDVLGGIMFWVALAGLVANVVALWVLFGADRENLNIRGALLHVAGDALGSIAALVAAAIILTTGWTQADPLLSMVVGLLLLRAAWGLVRESGHILLEGTPRGVAIGDIKSDLLDNIPDLDNVHHVHAWSLTQSQHLITLHASVSNGRDHEKTRTLIRQRLLDRFAIDHATIEIEHREDAKRKEAVP